MYTPLEEFPAWEISPKGDIRHRKTKKPKYFELRDGYPRTTFEVKGKRARRMVHRLVAQTFIPNPDGKETVNHINGVKDDNRAENLEWATFAENVQHAWATGLNENVSKMKCTKYATQLTLPGSGRGLVLFGWKEIRAAGFNDQVVSIHANRPGFLKLHKKHEVAIIPIEKTVNW